MCLDYSFVKYLSLFASYVVAVFVPNCCAKCNLNYTLEYC